MPKVKRFLPSRSLGIYVKGIYRGFYVIPTRSKNKFHIFLLFLQNLHRMAYGVESISSLL